MEPSFCVLCGAARVPGAPAGHFACGGVIVGGVIQRHPALPHPPAIVAPLPAPSRRPLVPTWAVALLAVGGVVLVGAVVAVLASAWVAQLEADASRGEGAPARLVATAMKVDVDDDAPEELVVAFEIFDAAGNATDCRCSVVLELGDETSGEWAEVARAEARPEAFGHVTLGEGVAARRAYVWSTTLDDAQLAPTCARRSIFDVRVMVEAGRGTLSDTSFASCR